MYLIEMGKTIMNFKKAFGVAAATMMSAAALTGCATAKTSSTAGNKSSDNTIRIGVNLELSGSVASYGQQEKKGVVLAAQEINKKGVKIGDDLQVGMMIEVPAAAILADQFAKEVDFF